MLGYAVQLECFGDFGENADEIIQFFFFGFGLGLRKSAFLFMDALLFARDLGAVLLHLRSDAGVLLGAFFDIEFFIRVVVSAAD
jgi:hypothetical protein